MEKISTLKFSEYNILNCRLDQLTFDSKCIIHTINQYSYTIAEIDDEAKLALQECDFLLPDGIGIVTAMRLIEGKNIKRITGSDLHLHLLKKLNSEHGSCFYLGSSDSTLIKIKQRIKQEFPNIRLQVYSPPFGDSFNKEENEKIIGIINDFNPNVLFVGMTAPKQEKWINANKLRLKPDIICSIGAVFDFYSKTVIRPSKFWQKLGLEWFIRLVKDPARMAKRYLYYGPIFCFLILKRKKSSS